MAELESRCEALEESQRNSLTEQLNRLSAENLQLRDRTDELSAEVEQLRGQLALAKYDYESKSNVYSIYTFTISSSGSNTIKLGSLRHGDPSRPCRRALLNGATTERMMRQR